MVDEILPPTSDDTAGNDPQLEHKSGMFRPVEEDPLPMEDSVPIDGQPSMVVIEATTSSPSVVDIPVASSENAPTQIQEVVVEAEVVPQEEPMPQAETIPQEEPTPQAETIPQAPIPTTPVESIPTPPRPTSGSGMGDPNTPIVPPVVISPVVVATPHTSSWKRILLILVFLGALGFLGYKYRFSSPPEILPTSEIPVETGALPAEVATGVEQGTADSAAITGEIVTTGEAIVPSDTVNSDDSVPGLQTFSATEWGFPVATLEYPQGWKASVSAIDWLKVMSLFDDQDVLQAKLLVFSEDQVEQYLMAQDAFDSIRISEKPFINEGFAGTLGLYSGKVDQGVVPGILALMGQPAISFDDTTNGTHYFFVLEPNMHKEMYTILRSLRLP